MDPEWKILMQEVGKNIEAVGRMLQRKPELSKQDMTDLRDTLNQSAETVQRVRDATFV